MTIKTGKRCCGEDRRTLIITFLQGYFSRRCKGIVRFAQVSFLRVALTKISANFRPYSYWPLVILSCSITQHLAIIFIFLAIFVELKEGILDPRSLVCISVLLFLVGYATWSALGTQQKNTNYFANR
jgi:hypothetical protein